MKIAFAGGYGVGLTMRVSRLPSPGETVLGGTFARGPGGKASNQAIAAARLGAAVSLLTAIGDDDAGREGLTLWSENNVDHGAVATVDAPTMTGFIIVDDAGENSIAVAPGALEELTMAHVESFRLAIRSAEMLVVSLEIPAPVAARLLEVAHEEGTRTLLNPAPALALPDAVWNSVDVVTPNRGEAHGILGGATVEDGQLAEALGRRLGVAVVMTLGAEGASVWQDGVTTAVAPVVPAEVVDTTGAGDAFTAALAVALTSGATVVEAARWACAAGAFAVATAGVVPSLAHLTDLPELAIARAATEPTREAEL